MNKLPQWVQPCTVMRRDIAFQVVARRLLGPSPWIFSSSLNRDEWPLYLFAMELVWNHSKIKFMTIERNAGRPSKRTFSVDLKYFLHSQACVHIHHNRSSCDNMPTHLLRLRHVLRSLDYDFASVLLGLVGVSRDKEDDLSLDEVQENCGRILTPKELKFSRTTGRQAPPGPIQ